MKKWLSLIVALVLACSLAVGALAEAAPQDHSDLYIGFVGMTLNNEFHIVLANAAKQEAEKYGIQLEVQAGATHASSDTQLGIVENYISQGVDGILLVPSSSEGLVAAIQACAEANIPIINLDTKLTDEVLAEAGMDIPFFGTNNYNGAKLAGEWVVANMPKGVVTAILTGIDGHTNAADRYNGFVDAAGDHIKLVATQTANWEVDQGYTAAQNIIQGNPDLQLIVCGNDNMGIGALSAVQEAGLEEQISIIGFDAVSEALNLVKSGEFTATVAQYPAQMGIQGVDAMVKILTGQKDEVPMNTDTGCELVTAENVDSFIEYVSQFAQ
ncbi:MAG: sugar ABC transporter substrate-binding protein [Candidatus Limiplasma sp.]|nr:sugar ABC transporter substrate-binding protein [Candidatus Limiplasma sp.]